MRRFVVLLVSLVALLTVPIGSGTVAQAATPAPPNSIASIGDSITRATDVCCSYGDHPANSWSTGGGAFDGVSSHYERIRSLNPDIAGRNYNDAAAGARMSAGPTQAQRAVDQRAKYVTILLGANDLCTSSPGTMTSVETFRSQFRQTLQTLDSGLPARARIFVSSIPDIYQLWQIYHTDWTARTVWDLANICQSMLSENRTEEQRQQVRVRNMAFNDVLEQECAAYARCRFDGDAVFNFQFARQDVSKLDYFHPNLTGQAALAEVTWQRSWWS
jgi:lysophospholipase L1-like esterase